MAKKFEKVEKPLVGFTYHLAWAKPGAKFQLTRILNAEDGEAWTGKNTLSIKLADLRELRNRTTPKNPYL
jgi:hypothetical protein